MSELSKRYAQAFYENLRDEEALHKCVELLTGDADLWRAMQNPCVQKKEKHAILQKLLGSWADQRLLNFLMLLCDRERMALLPEVERAYHALAMEEKNAADAVIRYAHPLTKEQMEQLSLLLCRRHHRDKVVLHPREDRALLGGFRIEMEGVTYDRSVKGMLGELQKYL